jgi:hypothetical protein
MTSPDDPATTTSFGGRGLDKGEAALRLSIRDPAGVGVGTTISEALAGSTAQAVLADELGYHRYWVAEHHGTPSVRSGRRQPIHTPEQAAAFHYSAQDADRTKAVRATEINGTAEHVATAPAALAERFGVPGVADLRPSPCGGDQAALLAVDPSCRFGGPRKVTRPPPFQRFRWPTRILVGSRHERRWCRLGRMRPVPPQWRSPPPTPAADGSSAGASSASVDLSPANSRSRNSCLRSLPVDVLGTSSTKSTDLGALNFAI